MIRFAPLLATAALALAAPASAATVIPVAHFNALELHGGGEVTLKYGPVQRVTLIAGDTKYSVIEVKNGRLEVTPCRSWWDCPRQYDFKVEIVTPSLSAVSVHGGGELTSEGKFPVQHTLALSVHGGGDVDLRSMPAETVSAEVHGGGDLQTSVSQSLSASVYGGGDLTYWGHPAQLAVATHGGGSINRGGE
jgi:hypothetical protein